MRTAILTTLLAMPLVVPLWGTRVRGARGGLRRTLVLYLLFNLVYVVVMMYIDEGRL